LLGKFKAHTKTRMMWAVDTTRAFAYMGVPSG